MSIDPSDSVADTSADVAATFAEILRRQESALISRIQAVRATGKAEIIGADLEAAVRDALGELLPSTIRVVPGFIACLDGRLSSHFDGLLVDTRFPLLASVAGNAVVPLHAVLGAIEIKTNLDARELENVIKKEREIVDLGSKLQEALHLQQRERLALLNKEGPEGSGGIDRERFEYEIDMTGSMVVDAPVPGFWSLALESDISQMTIAEKMWSGKATTHLVVLRPKEERRRKEKLPYVWRFGTDGPARHFWREGDTNPLLCIRGTKFGFGYFLLDMLIHESVLILSGRTFQAWEVREHIMEYMGFGVDIEETKGRAHRPPEK